MQYFIESDMCVTLAGGSYCVIIMRMKDFGSNEDR